MDAVSVRKVTHTNVFDQFAFGAAGTGHVDELGGSALPGHAGVSPQWVRIAVVEMYMRRGVSSLPIELLPSQTGVAAYGRGLVPWETVELKGVLLDGPTVPKSTRGSRGQ